MSHEATNQESSSSKTKRIYRKGNAMSASEKQLASVARKRMTHRGINVFVPNSLKDKLIEFCSSDGVTQGEFIEYLLELEIKRRKSK